MTALDQFHFLRPLWLLALFGLLVLVWLMVQRKLGSRGWEQFCDASLLPFVLIGDTYRSRPWSAALILAGGLLAILSLAGPVWEKLPQPVFSSRSALVIALDLSRSMDADDISPTRLIRARYKVADILNLRQDGQTALIVYAGDSYTVTPLTDDVATIASQLNALTTDIMPAPGSDAGRALGRAAELLRQAGAGTGDVLLITDEVDADHSMGEVDSLTEKGYRLSILGVGTEYGVPVPLADGGFMKDAKGRIVVPVLDEGPMRRMAAAGGGQYVQITQDDADVQRLARLFSSAGLEDGQLPTEFQTDTWREQGPWLLLLLLPLMALMFRRGYLAVLLICLLHVPDGAQAFEWRDLWLRGDQQARRAFADGEHERAAEQFKDPAWKGSAQYRAGDFGAAADTLGRAQDTASIYNRGNALARQGRYPEAIAAYEEVLGHTPDDEDARFNKKLLEDLLQKQQQEQQQQGQGAEPPDQDRTDQQQAQDSGRQQESSGSDEQHQDESDAPSQAADEQRQDEEQQQSQQQQDRNEQAQQQRGGAEEDDPQQAGQQRQATPPDDMPPDEQQQALEQWLRRIPDDPGGLLRRKFLYQYQQRAEQPEAGSKTW